MKQNPTDNRIASLRFTMRLWPLIAALSIGCGSLFSLGCLGEGQCNDDFDCEITEICGRDKTCVELPGACKEGVGTLSGIVTAPDGETPVSNATVTVAGMDGVEITTGPDGTFEVGGVDSGAYTVLVERGKYGGEQQATVCADQETNVKVPVQPGPHSMAVVPGSYDSVEEILARMGFIQGNHFDLLTEEDLMDLGMLTTYDFLFLNCTNDPIGDDPQVQSNLRAFVNGGGGLYASDWAYNYVDGAFAGDIIFPENVKDGDVGELDGNIINTDLAAYMQKNTVRLNYDLPSWVTIQSVASVDSVWVTGTYAGYTQQFINSPLLVTFSHGEGKVTYTTFHNEAQTTQDMEVILGYVILNL